LNQLKQFHRDRPHELQPVELTATAAKAASKTIRFIAVSPRMGRVRRGEFAPEGQGNLLRGSCCANETGDFGQHFFSALSRTCHTAC
jgi:hypothetical protein